MWYILIGVKLNSISDELTCESDDCQKSSITK